MFSECNQNMAQRHSNAFEMLLNRSYHITSCSYLALLHHEFLFSHTSVSNTLLLSTNLIWRSEENLYSGLGVFFKWWIFCYSGTEGSSPPKASQTLFAVKDLPCCHRGEHPPQEHHSFQQGSPGTDTSVSLCLIKTKLSQHYEVKYNTKEKTI